MDDNKSLEKSLDQYVDAVVAQKDLDGFSPEQIQSLKEKIKEMLVEQINREILKSLPEDKLAEFEEIVDDENKPLSELGALVEEANIDMEAIVKRVVDNFQDIFLKEEN